MIGNREGSTMKKIITAMAAVAAAFTMASCVKEQPVEPEVPPVVGEDIIIASTEGSLTKTSLSGSDTAGYEVVWSEGDEITIGGSLFVLKEGASTTTGTFQGTLPEDGAHTACYPATYNGTDWPASQNYSEGNITGSPMKAPVTVSGGKVSGRLQFTNAGGILRLTVKGSENILVSSIIVSANGLEDITLNCGDGIALNSTDGTVFHIAMPEGSYSGTSIMLLAKGGKNCIKRLSSRDLEIERSKITPASFSANFTSTAPEGALPEAFTVSADGKMVFFSKGNLWCDTDANPAGANFHFEDNQYDSTPSTSTDRAVSHISHFMWCRSAADAVKDTYSETGNSADDILFTNVAGFTVNGLGNWYAPSHDEMDYLLMSRKASTVGGTANARYFSGRIDKGSENYVNGLFVIPDVFAWPESELPNAPMGINQYRYNYTDNTYSVSEFASLQQAGVVFLPCAGSRDRYPNVIYVNKSGYYWYSTLDGADKAGHLGFSVGGSVLKDSFNSRDKAYSIRLVTDSTPTFTVTFDMNGHGTAPAAISGIRYRSTIAKPSDPTAAGYVFAGWYKDKGCETKWNFASDLVTADITLHAKWVVDENVLPGLFTVSDDGKGNVRKIQFSRGNLTATIDAAGIPVSWAFAEKQYQCLGEGGANMAIGKAAGEVDLFGWSTDATIYGISTSSKDKDYSGDFVEWGDNIGDGRTWRTMTTDEWNYLFNGRTMLNGKAGYTLNITYCGTMGVVLYPDDYNGPALISGTNYTDETFPDACVFLPAAGRRWGFGLLDVGVKGVYWSSSPYSINAYCMKFDAETANLGGYNWRWEGSSVRLVIEPTHTVTFDMNGHGKAPADITGVPTHSTVKEPVDIPTAMGYMFAGWYKDRNCTVKWDFNSDMVTADTSIYARWIEAPAGALPGIFSIAEGRHVYFSKGNLIATISSNGAPTAWKFAANQYDCLGKGGANETIGTSEGDIDFFGWSTTSTTYGISTSSNNYDYSGDFVDWGNAIGDGSTWRTMSTSEWEYLSQRRAMSYVDFRYTLNITYGGKKGAVLYPDDYNGPALIPGTNYTDETFPETCVFLPAAGYRDGSKVADLTYHQGRYRTSDASGDDAARTFIVYFNSADFRPSRNDYRFPGYSVRLVTDGME